MMEKAQQKIREESRQLSRQAQGYEVQSMRNWYLLSAITAISTVALVIALSPAIRQSIRSYWPGANTDVVLLSGLVGMILIFILHLTLQQLKVRAMRQDLRELEEQTAEKDKRSSARLHALLNVTRLLGAVNDSTSLFEGIARTCLEIFDCQQASVMLLDPESGRLQVKAAAGHADLDKVLGAEVEVGVGISGHVAHTREPLLLGEKSGNGSYRGFELQAKHLTAAMVTPILVRDELVGVLNISSGQKGINYTNEDLQALQVFAENVGTCIRQLERSEWMRQTIERQQAQLATVQPE
jgi:transcriptional regulator with GAF, ATPase, and Fis domain